MPKVFYNPAKKSRINQHILAIMQIVQICVPVRTWKLGLEQQRPLVQQGGVRCVCKAITTVIVWLDEQRLTKKNDLANMFLSFKICFLFQVLELQPIKAVSQLNLTWYWFSTDITISKCQGQFLSAKNLHAEWHSSKWPGDFQGVSAWKELHQSWPHILQKGWQQ